MASTFSTLSQTATEVPQYRSTAVPEPLPELTPSLSSLSRPATTAVPEYRSTGATESPIPKERFYRKANEFADHIDCTLTPAESKVFEQLLRLSVGFNRDTCQVRISVLMDRSGYSSDKTVRTALKGLELKGRIEKVTTRNSPLGDEYRILAYSGNTAVPQYRGRKYSGTGVKSYRRIKYRFKYTKNY